MPEKTSLIDTNILVRFLIEDNKLMAAAAGELFSRAGNRSLAIPDVIIAETVYVLKSVYTKTKSEIAKSLLELIDFPIFDLDKKTIKSTLEIWKHHNISFVDAYLCALNRLGKHGLIYTFDQGLKKISGVNIQTPSKHPNNKAA